MKGDDSAVAHVADGVVGGGKAVVSTFLELHTTLRRWQQSASVAAVRAAKNTSNDAAALSFAKAHAASM